MRKSLLFLFIPSSILFMILLSGTSACSKTSIIDNEMLQGKWISTDFADTIEFSNDKDLYKMINGFRDHYDYSLSGNMITIAYNGVCFILVVPSTHSLELERNLLTIDFREPCFGFRQKLITFKRTTK
jgi:hypothetical protein